MSRWKYSASGLPAFALPGDYNRYVMTRNHDLLFMGQQIKIDITDLSEVAFPMWENSHHNCGSQTFHVDKFRIIDTWGLLPHTPARDCSLPLMRVDATPLGSRLGKEFLASVAWRYNSFTFFRLIIAYTSIIAKNFLTPPCPGGALRRGSPPKYLQRLVFSYHASSRHHADSIWV